MSTTILGINAIVFVGCCLFFLYAWYHQKKFWRDWWNEQSSGTHMQDSHTSGDSKEQDGGSSGTSSPSTPSQ